MLFECREGKANIFQKWPGLDGQNGLVYSEGFGLARGGWTGADGWRQAGGSDRKRPHENICLLKNAVLDHFWPFLKPLDLKNGSGSKFRF